MRVEQARDEKGLLGIQVGHGRDHRAQLGHQRVVESRAGAVHGDVHRVGVDAALARQILARDDGRAAQAVGARQELGIARRILRVTVGRYAVSCSNRLSPSPIKK